MNLPLTATGLAQRFDHPSVLAIALLSSHARGDAGPFSDVDLLRLVAADAPELPDNGTHLVDGRLVNVSSATPADTASWFERPEETVSHIAGLRVARALVDRDGALAELQARANAFVWDAAMQERAGRWASRQLVGWVEEAHKGLEGLRRGDVGRLLNARRGCSWRLNHVMQVQRGVLVSGDNAVYDEVGAAMADQPEWLRLRRFAFGLRMKQASRLRSPSRRGLAFSSTPSLPSCSTPRSSPTTGRSSCSPSAACARGWSARANAGDELTSAWLSCTAPGQGNPLPVLLHYYLCPKRRLSKDDIVETSSN